MANVYYDRDADLSLLDGKRVAVLGYGSQGHAQAQNLRDSGVDVVVGVRPNGQGWKRAEQDGFRVSTVAEAVSGADIVHVLIPDETQRTVFEQEIRPNLKTGAALGFSHGFNIHFSQVVPPREVDVFMIAPKAPGHVFRRLVAEGAGVPGLLAVHQDYSGQAKQLALAFGKALGCARAGIIETTFQEETETDLFGEQAVLCGGVSELVKAGFETLVEAGYQPEIAFFECMNELKLIVDLMYEGGITWMRYSISDTAQYGDMTRGKRVINEASRRAMREILEEIQSGVFAKEWILENQAGRPSFNAIARREASHPLETTGRRLRRMMSWLAEANQRSEEELAVRGLMADG